MSKDFVDLSAEAEVVENDGKNKVAAFLNIDAFLASDGSEQEWSGRGIPLYKDTDRFKNATSELLIGAIPEGEDSKELTIKVRVSRAGKEKPVIDFTKL